MEHNVVKGHSTMPVHMETDVPEETSRTVFGLTKYEWVECRGALVMPVLICIQQLSIYAWPDSVSVKAERKNVQAVAGDPISPSTVVRVILSIEQVVIRFDSRRTTQAERHKVSCRKPAQATARHRLVDLVDAAWFCRNALVPKEC